MADFDTVFGAAFIATPWVDQASASPPAPSRLNSDPSHSPLYMRVTVPQTFLVQAVIGGVVGPDDSTLGGRLFEAHWVEWSGNSPPIYVQPSLSGFSSRVQIQLLAEHVGHFCFCMMRPDGGAILIHFDGST